MERIDNSMITCILTFTFTNWKGETNERYVVPNRLWFGITKWHPEPQWFLNAFDICKCEDRDFPLSKIQFKR